MNTSHSFVLELSAAAVLIAVCGCSKPVEQTVDSYVEATEKAIALGDIPAARESISNAWMLASGEIDVRLLKAQVDFYSMDYASAAKIYKGVANDPALDRKVRAQGWAGLGVVQHYANERDAARIDFLKALRLDRKNASAWYHLGYLYHNGYGYFEAASDCYETYVRLETLADERVRKVQRSFLPTLREARTNQILEIPGSRSPNRAECTKALAAAEEAMKKKSFRTAKLRYEDALKADPTSFPAAVGLAKLLQSTDTSAEGRKRALALYCRASKLSPSSIRTFVAAGEFAQSSGNYLTARELYSRALAADPTNTTLIDGYIRALKKLNSGKLAAQYQDYRDFLTANSK